MDKSYATPELAKMAMYWGFDRPCSAGVTVKAPVLYAERETLDSVPDGIIPIPTLASGGKEGELAHGIASQFGIWRSEKR